jgi:hypothetical protein
MAHENRWLTVLKNGGSFHGELLVINQMVSQNGLIHIFLGMIHFSQEW